MIKVKSIFLISIIIIGLIASPSAFKFNKDANSHVVSLNPLSSLEWSAFAESGNNDNVTIDKNMIEQQQKNEHQSESSNENNHTQSEYQSESSNENNHTQSEYQSESSNENNHTQSEYQSEANQEGIDEINNENNNGKATHEENQQDANNIENAVENKTIAAEVNIGTGNEETKSIDSNINVHTNSTSDAVSVTVDSKTESGPKVMVFNLNSTTIDVSNVKYLHITYDGHPIAPATDVNTVLHPKSTDEPSYAILITQNGAQILVSIPHFSSHTITLSNISKVIQPVPEFPIPALALIVALISIVIFSKVSIRGKN